MDFNKLIARVKAILLTPKTEWPVIAAEEASTGGLYKDYIIWLAGAAAVASFISMSLIGCDDDARHLPCRHRHGLTWAVIGLVQALVLTGVLAWLIDALAPTFGGQKNRVQALKTAAYAFTAGWVASIAAIVPVLGWLIALAGMVYGIYLLYLGLPHTMKCPPEKAAGYTAVTVVIAIVVGWILSAVVGGLAVRAGFMGMGGFGGLGGMTRDGGRFDRDSRGGKLEQWAKDMEEAGQRVEDAEKSGDPRRRHRRPGGFCRGAGRGQGTGGSTGTRSHQGFPARIRRRPGAHRGVGRAQWRDRHAGVGGRGAVLGQRRAEHPTQGHRPGRGGRPGRARRLGQYRGGSPDAYRLRQDLQVRRPHGPRAVDNGSNWRVHADRRRSLQRRGLGSAASVDALKSAVSASTSAVSRRCATRA
jgi:hypothetical protein